MSKKLTLEDVEQEFIKREFIPLFKEYKNNREKLLAKTEEGYKIFVSLHCLKTKNSHSFFGNGNPYTVENIKLWLKLNNKPYELLSEKYEIANKKLRMLCKKHGEFEICWGNLQQGDRCPKCAGVYKCSLEEAKVEFLKRGYTPLFDEYNNTHQKLVAETKEGYKITTSLSNLKTGFVPSIFGNGNPYTIHNIKLWLKLNGSSYELISIGYNGSNEKLIFECSEHGEFKISWSDIKQGHGCKLCGMEKLSGFKKISIDEAKDEFIKLGYKPLFKEYIDSGKNLFAETKEGFIISTSLSRLKQGYAPNIIGKSNPYTIDNIKLWLKLNNSPYELVSQTFTGSSKKLEFNCKKHGCFNISWNSLQSGIGCRICGIEKVKNSKKLLLEDVKEEFIKQGYKPLFEEYNNNYERLLAETKEGYIIYMSLANMKNKQTPHIIGHGNPYTIENIKLWLEINNSPYELLSDSFIKSNKNLKMKCPKHGEFQIRWNNLQQGKGCSICCKSKGEQKIGKWLKNNAIEFIPQKEFEGLIGTGGGNLSYDFYLPQHNLLIEYDGEMHYMFVKGVHKVVNNFKKQLEHDKRKNNYAKDDNIDLLRIPYWEFDNIDQILENKLIGVDINHV